MTPVDRRGVDESTVQVTVDRDACCGSGNCVRTAPEVFAQDDSDGLVLLRVAAPPAGSGEQVRHAADLCPTGAIRVTCLGVGQ